MKKLLVLPGHSPKNKIWGEACVDSLLDSFDVVYLQNYDHWELPDGKLNWIDEIEKIHITVEGTADEVGQWYVAAKSIGSILALQAVAKQAIKPVKFIFFGMPLDLAAKDAFSQSWAPLSLCSVPGLVFHNEDDPTASYDFTKNKLKELAPNFSLITLEGNTHDYLDFQDYLPTIGDFLNK